MCEKHYSIMMMGEDSTDDLQEREDALANAMAEYDAVQDGGLGGYYDDDNYGYNYQDSNPLTDIDYQPTDESSAFTSNYTGADDYDPVNRDSKEDGNNSYGDTNDSRYGYSDDEDFDGDGGNYDRDAENYDGDDSNRKQYSNADTSDGGEDGDESSFFGNAKRTLGKVDDINNDFYRGVINWRPGDPITLPLLAKTWDSVARLNELKHYIDIADATVTELLNSTGPNIMIRLHRWTQKISDPFKTNIGCLLQLISSDSQRTLYTTFSGIEAIFDGQVSQPLLIVGLKKAFDIILSNSLVAGLMNKIYSVAVPIINRANMSQNAEYMMGGGVREIPKNEYVNVEDEIMVQRKKTLQEKEKKRQEKLERNW